MFRQLHHEIQPDYTHRNANTWTIMKHENFCEAVSRNMSLSLYSTDGGGMGVLLTAHHSVGSHETRGQVLAARQHDKAPKDAVARKQVPVCFQSHNAVCGNLGCDFQGQAEQSTATRLFDSHGLLYDAVGVHANLFLDGHQSAVFV